MGDFNQRWAVLVSGRGSNAQAAFEMQNETRIVGVWSSDKTAQALVKARRFGVATFVIPRLSDRKLNWVELHEQLRIYKITHIFLLGFMQIVPADFVLKWQNQIYNLHPSLLPKYPGLKSIAKALANRDDIGVSVHIVTSQVDAGRILCQKRTFAVNELHAQSLEEVELHVHIDEQRVLQKVLGKCKVA